MDWVYSTPWLIYILLLTITSTASQPDSLNGNNSILKNSKYEPKKYRLITDCPTTFGTCCKCIKEVDQLPFLVTRFPPFRYEYLTEVGTADEVLDKEILTNTSDSNLINGVIKSQQGKTNTANTEKLSNSTSEISTPIVMVICERGNSSEIFEKDLKLFKKWHSDKISQLQGPTKEIETVLILYRNNLGKLGFTFDASGLAKSEFDGLNMVNHLVLIDNKLANISQITFAPLFSNLQVLTVVDRTMPKTANTEKIEVLQNAMFELFEALEGGELNKLVSLNVELTQVDQVSQGIFRNLKTPALTYFSFKSNTLKNLFNGSFEGLNPNMTEVYLSGKRFQNIPWNALSHFDNIQVLSLDLEFGKLGDISEVKTQGFKVPACNIINFDDSYIKFIGPNAFSNAGVDKLSKSLEGLNLARVSLEAIKDNAFAGLENLIFLSLSENLVNNLSKSVLNGLSKLQILLVDSNNLEYVEDSNEYSFRETLKKLSLKSNNLTTVPLKFLESLQQLRFLDLSTNNLTWPPLPSVNVNKGMQALTLNLTKLEGLNLANNHITVLKDPDLSGLKDSLIWLDISKNGLKELPKFMISTFPRLKFLDLRDNNISNLSDLAIVYDKIPNLSDSLQFIGLSGNPWYCDCRTKILVSLIYNRLEELSFTHFKRQIHDLSTAYCVAPESTKGFSLLSLLHKELCNVTNSSSARNDPKTEVTPLSTTSLNNREVSSEKISKTSKSDSKASTTITLVLNGTKANGKVPIVYENIEYVPTKNGQKVYDNKRKHGFGIALGILTTVAVVVGIILVCLRQKFLSHLLKYSGSSGRNPLILNLNPMKHHSNVPLPFDRNFVYTKMESTPDT